MIYIIVAKSTTTKNMHKLYATYNVYEILHQWLDIFR